MSLAERDRISNFPARHASKVGCETSARAYKSLNARVCVYFPYYCTVRFRAARFVSVCLCVCILHSPLIAAAAARQYRQCNECVRVLGRRHQQQQQRQRRRHRRRQSSERTGRHDSRDLRCCCNLRGAADAAAADQ